MMSSKNSRMEIDGDDRTFEADTAMELEEFDAVFPEILNILCEGGDQNPEALDAFVWFRKVTEYNVPHGKKNRGVSVVSSYRHLVEHPGPENLKIARVLGWCIEFFQAYFLVTDDILDVSTTRRGAPCWYRVKNVGMVAVNDALFLESAIYKLLKKFIRDKPYYLSVLELFLETAFQTTTGQCLDIITAPSEEQVDFTQYTRARHAAIVKWKTAYYSFYLPVAIAMYMAGVSNKESHMTAKKILLDMGHFFQVQDDYLDCYGAPEIIGKIGTDIEDNKCSWLIVTALDMASDTQKQMLMENYGKKEKRSVEKVKMIYQELDLQRVYREYEEQSYQELLTLIFNDSGDLPKQIFSDFANRIYKRRR